MQLNDVLNHERRKGPNTSRLSFLRASGHLGQREPGYYLILLRTELRHRSLRRKPPSE
jgi:hypothetical protein